MLERAEDEGCLIVNKPQSLRDANEKLHRLVCRAHPDHARHSQSRQAAGLPRPAQGRHPSPLDGMGGASIFRMKEDDANVGVIIETLTSHGSQYCMACRLHLPAIMMATSGVLVVDGEPVPYCLAASRPKG